MAARKVSSRTASSKRGARKASPRTASARKASPRTASARKSGSRRDAGSGGRLGAALSRFELPPTLHDYAAQVTDRLDGLEREVTRTSTDVRRRAARLIREASHQLGRLEEKGEAGWRRLTRPYRRQLVDLLGRLEKAVAPRPARKKASRKAVRRVREAMDDVAAAVDERG
jgi:hypothetical protein